MHGVALTSHVKSWREQAPDGFCLVGASLVMWGRGRAGARQPRRVLLRRAGGGLPPDGSPSGAGRPRGTRGPSGLGTPSRRGVAVDGQVRRRGVMG
jgi:hypothetical protein